MTTPFEKAQASKTFCIFPWIHQYVGTSGDVKPCCVYNHNSEIGNLNDNTLAEIWNNNNTKEMRKNFLNGIEDPACSSCNIRDSIAENVSFRSTAGEHWMFGYEREFQAMVKDIVNSTEEDGSVPEHKLLYMDVRFNNLCNLSCRTCSPHFSTSWIVDARKIENRTDKREKDDGFQFPGRFESSAFEEMRPHFPTLRQIYFAGGEPLMQKEHYDTLDEMTRIGNDVNIVYNTNFSKLSLGDKHVLDYWKRFSKIIVNASLDGSHERGELWRNGTVWEDVVANRKLMKKETPHVEFWISFTLSWVNSFNMFDFHKEWVEQGLVEVDHIILNILDGPMQYSLKNIPDFKKQKIQKEFEDYIAWLKSMNAKDTTVSKIENAIAYMWSEVGALTKKGSIKKNNVDHAMRVFSGLTKKLDEIRNQKFIDVFPEHADIFEYITEHDLEDKDPWTTQFYNL